MNEEKKHSKKCASFHHKYSRNISDVMSECDCDGYHTFAELYEHRITLFIALCEILYLDPQYQTGRKAEIWRSKKNGDDSEWDGWFILGIGKDKGGQITYHLPLSRWEETNFAETLEKAPEFDGHTSDDVLERLKKL